MLGVPLPSVVKAITCDLPQATFLMGASSVGIWRWYQAPSSPNRFGEQSNGCTHTEELVFGAYAAINPTPREIREASCSLFHNFVQSTTLEQ